MSLIGLTEEAFKQVVQSVQHTKRAQRNEANWPRPWTRRHGGSKKTIPVKINTAISAATLGTDGGVSPASGTGVLLEKSSTTGNWVPAAGTSYLEFVNGLPDSVDAPTGGQWKVGYLEKIYGELVLIQISCHNFGT